MRLSSGQRTKRGHFDRTVRSGTIRSTSVLHAPNGGDVLGADRGAKPEARTKFQAERDWVTRMQHNYDCEAIGPFKHSDCMRYRMSWMIA
jgi:hypothetical protein